MNSCPVCAGLLSRLRLLRFAASLFVLLALTLSVSAAGTIVGSVTSKDTGNALQGALVSLPGLKRTALTDGTGSFLFQGVPAGAQEMSVSYTGFTESRQTVTVSDNQTARFDLGLTSSGVMSLAAYTVASEREGQALAVTQQREATNIKNVTAIDEWGVLPTQNVGELLSRMPGITFTTDEDNLINNISIRGQPSSYTRLNVDGMPSTGVGGDGRSATLHSFSASQYEQIEVIASQTPDKRADSLGGQINLVTRSPFSISGMSRITYNASVRYLPPFSSRNDDTSHHALKPDANVSYTQIFNVFGGKRNLGINVLAGNQEVINQHDWSLMQYENTTAPTAFFRDYQRSSGFNDRFISAFSARADYRFSDRTRVSLQFLYNAGSEPFFHYTFVEPFVNVNLSVYDPLSNPTGSIAPGSNSTRTEVLATAANNTALTYSQMLLNPQRFSFTSVNPTGTLLFYHNFGKLKIDHGYRWSKTHWDSGAGKSHEDGSITMRTAAPIGFILNNADLTGRVFTQTSGPSVYAASSYSPFLVSAATTTTQPVPITSMQFNSRDTVTDTNEVSGIASATYSFEGQVPVVLKIGGDTVNRRVNNRNVSPRRWYGVVGSVHPVDALMPITEFELQHGGQRLPVLDPAAVRASTLNNPALWYEDTNFTAVQQYTNRRIFEEGVDSGYIQAQIKLGRFTALGGVRKEWVDTETFTYFRARSTLISVEPDNFKRAALDFNKQSRDASYANAFPSLHMTYDLTSRLKLRASYSTSYGRPTLAQVVAGATASDTARTVTVGNPELKPQFAKDIDLRLDYYFSNSGAFTITGYQKKITDYVGAAGRSGLIIPDSPNNGYDGLYGGYELIQPLNIGSAKLRGFEADIRERLDFLPGALKGLTARANFTYLKTDGKFAGALDLQSDQVPNFVPRAGNAGLSYSYKDFGASFDVNYKGRYTTAYSATTPGTGNQYQSSLTTMNAGISYQLRPSMRIYLNVANLNEKAPRQYTYLESRTRYYGITARAVKLGVTGSF